MASVGTCTTDSSYLLRLTRLPQALQERLDGVDDIFAWLEGKGEAQVWAEVRPPPVLLQHSHQPLALDRRVGVEVQRHLVRPLIHRGHQVRTQDPAQVHHLEKLQDQFWQGTKAVFHFISQILQVGPSLHVRQLLIKDQPLVDVRDVGLGNISGQTKLDLGFDLYLDLTTPQLLHRLLQHLGVQLKSYCCHLAGLFLAQQVAGPADLQVMGRKAKAAPQVVEFLQDL